MYRAIHANQLAQSSWSGAISLISSSIATIYESFTLTEGLWLTRMFMRSKPLGPESLHCQNPEFKPFMTILMEQERNVKNSNWRSIRFLHNFCSFSKVWSRLVYKLKSTGLTSMLGNGLRFSLRLNQFSESYEREAFKRPTRCFWWRCVQTMTHSRKTSTLWAIGLKTT